MPAADPASPIVFSIPCRVDDEQNSIDRFDGGDGDLYISLWRVSPRVLKEVMDSMIHDSGNRELLSSGSYPTLWVIHGCSAEAQLPN